jgi:PD-(D/E)XK endonuclease
MKKATEVAARPVSGVNSSSNLPIHRNAKRRGEVAEAAFLSKAVSLGFEVAKPWGDSAPFDFIVNTGPNSWRVQIKSAYKSDKLRYAVRAEADNIPYTKENIDFLVAYVVPENAWYVIPVAALGGRANLWLYPHKGSKSRFEPYREAWCLMACQHDGDCNPDIDLRAECKARAAGICPALGDEINSNRRSYLPR